MVNQVDSKEFDELIKDIDKLKLLIVDKFASKMEASNYKKLKQDYQAERYDAVMTSRYQGKNFDILFNEKNGGKPGTVILVNDSSTLYVLDIVGTVDVSKVGPLFNQLNESSDLGGKIKDFIGKKNKRHKFDEDEDEDDDNKGKKNSDH